MSNVTYPWWSAEDNNYVHNHDGNMAVIACFGYDNTYVDSYVYQNCMIFQRVINLSDKYLHPDQGYDTPALIPIQFNADTKQFIILTRCKNVDTYQFCDRLKECVDKISEESNDTVHIVVNLAKMSFDKNNTSQCMECYAYMDYVEYGWTIKHIK